MSACLASAGRRCTIWAAAAPPAEAVAREAAAARVGATGCSEGAVAQEAQEEAVEGQVAAAREEVVETVGAVWKAEEEGMLAAIPVVVVTVEVGTATAVMEVGAGLEVGARVGVGPVAARRVVVARVAEEQAVVALAAVDSAAAVTAGGAEERVWVGPVAAGSVVVVRVAGELAVVELVVVALAAAVTAGGAEEMVMVVAATVMVGRRGVAASSEKVEGFWEGLRAVEAVEARRSTPGSQHRSTTSCTYLPRIWCVPHTKTSRAEVAMAGVEAWVVVARAMVVVGMVVRTVVVVLPVE